MSIIYKLLCQWSTVENPHNSCCIPRHIFYWSNLHERRYHRHKYTTVSSCSMDNWASELSNGIWHAYMGMSYTVGKVLIWLFGWDDQNLCPPNFGLAAPLIYISCIFSWANILTLHFQRHFSCKSYTWQGLNVCKPAKNKNKSI